MKEQGQEDFANNEQCRIMTGGNVMNFTLYRICLTNRKKNNEKYLKTEK